MVTSSPSRIQTAPNANTTSQCQRANGSRSSLAGTSVSTTLSEAVRGGPHEPGRFMVTCFPASNRLQPRPRRRDQPRPETQGTSPGSIGSRGAVSSVRQHARNAQATYFQLPTSLASQRTLKMGCGLRSLLEPRLQRVCYSPLPGYQYRRQAPMCVPGGPHAKLCRI